MGSGSMVGWKCGRVAPLLSALAVLLVVPREPLLLSRGAAVRRRRSRTGSDRCFQLAYGDCTKCVADAGCGICHPALGGAPKCKEGGLAGPDDCAEVCDTWQFLTCDGVGSSPTSCRATDVSTPAPASMEPTVSATEQVTVGEVRESEEPPEAVDVSIVRDLAKAEGDEMVTLKPGPAVPLEPQQSVHDSEYEARRKAEEGILSTQPIRDQLMKDDAEEKATHAEDLDAMSREDWSYKRRMLIRRQMEEEKKQFLREGAAAAREAEAGLLPPAQAGATGAGASAPGLDGEATGGATGAATGTATGAAGEATGPTGANAMSDSEHWYHWKRRAPIHNQKEIVDGFHGANGHHSDAGFLRMWNKQFAAVRHKPDYYYATKADAPMQYPRPEHSDLATPS